MSEFLLFAVVGFLAQTIDGALGMAYGVVASASLLAFGVSPLETSAAVHAAKLFTTAASGAAHWWHGNVARRLALCLAVTGAVGGICGALLLGHLDGASVRPVVTLYLALLGALIVWRSFRAEPAPRSGVVHAVPLGLAGGFLDAIGGGGWGPVVTSGLIGAGVEPRLAVGSVNAAEFVVSVTVSVAFLFVFIALAPDGHSPARPLAAIAGLIAGGLVAAPLAARLVRGIHRVTAMRVVGVLVIALAAWQLVQRLAG